MLKKQKQKQNNALTFEYLLVQQCVIMLNKILLKKEHSRKLSDAVKYNP